MTTASMDGLKGLSNDNNGIIDHGELSAIAEFNKAHDESQRASNPVAAPPQPLSITPPNPSTAAASRPEPMQIDISPIRKTVDTTKQSQSQKPAPTAPAPTTSQAPAANPPSTPVSAGGVKRPAEGPPDMAASPTKRQHIVPQTPVTPRVQTREQSVASQTSTVNGQPSLNEQVPPESLDGYGTDSDDDFEKHPPGDTADSISRYTYSASFANGQLLDPSQHLRIHSLPILDNLSSQLLTTLLQGQYQDTLITVTQPDTDRGQAYVTLKALFEQTKRLYASEAFLATEELKFQMPEHRNMIRKVNLATFVSSLFGSTEVGFFHLNEHFLDTFVPEGGRLLKNQGGLFLDLKTQAYISALDQGEKTKEQLLDDLFESDMANKLTDRRGGSKELIPSEIEFVSRVKNRREKLEVAPSDVSVLRQHYPWQEFLRDMILYVAKHKDSILSPTTRKKLKRLDAANGDSSKHMFQAHTQSPSSLYGQPLPLYGIPPGLSTPVFPGYSHIGRPSTYAHSGQSVGAIGPGLDHTSLSGSTPNPALSIGTSQSLTAHPEQTTPTHILYEQARLAATARQSPNARRAGLPSQRRPWSSEEERALMAGLDCVKGPHWSQILAMFGAGGTVSEALKDRNQVQLKDKARNLKLFFLKSGLEVPYYLQFVTGELKTRAPGQVAKNEKRKQQEEEANQNRATVDALNVLTNAKSSEGSQTPMGHPAPQAPRPQPTHVPTPHHPQRWAMSHNQPQPHAHPGHSAVAAQKSEPSASQHVPTQQSQYTTSQQAQQQTRPQAPPPPPPQQIPRSTQSSSQVSAAPPAPQPQLPPPAQSTPPQPKPPAVEPATTVT